MARGTWKNNDGLYIRYGVEQGDRKDRSGVTASTTKDVELELLITLTGAATRLISPTMVFLTASAVLTLRSLPML